MDPDDAQLPEDLKQKFVPYLTMSPCLIRPAKNKRHFFDKSYGRRNQANFTKVAMEAKNRPKAFREMFVLKSLADSVEELKIEVKEVSRKLAHIQEMGPTSTEV